MNIVTKLEPYGNRTKVYIDNELAFVLYKGEIRKFHIEEDMEVSEQLHKDIEELLYARAKERSLYILEGSYKTEKQITDKLKQGFYPIEIIERVLEFLIQYNFVNDSQYASMYIEYKSANKSKKKIIQDLYSKGICKEKINNAIEDSGFTDRESLDNVIKKRISKYDLTQIKEKQKLYQYLVGKGYSYGDIKTALNSYDRDD